MTGGRPAEIGDTDRRWMQKAACDGMDTSIFFPVYGDMSDRSETVSVLSVCDRCQVREECLEYAIIENIQYGIWGGQGSYMRNKIRKERYGY